MRHFATYVWIDNQVKEVEFTQHKSRQMYISNAFDYNGHEINLVMSYDTYIGFIVDSRTLITWGYSEYSCTTSKQITQLLYDYDLRMNRVKKFTYNDIEMLKYYLEWLA